MCIAGTIVSSIDINNECLEVHLLEVAVEDLEAQFHACC
jgi:hypothetical protein